MTPRGVGHGVPAGTVIVLSADPVRQCVDFSVERWPAATTPAGPLRFRLVGADGSGVLVVDAGDLATRSEPEREAAQPGRMSPSRAVLPLSDLGAALNRVLPEESHRAVLVDALGLCLDRWRPDQGSQTLAGLHAEAMRAWASVAPPRARLAGAAGDAPHGSETSVEALFRTLHYCRLQADALA